jgi:hypothetical protein
MTQLEQLKAEVEEKMNAVVYDWKDTDTNLRLIEEARAIIDGNLDLPAKHIAEVAVACREYVQIRDFFMGVGYVEKPKNNVMLYLAKLTEALDVYHSVPALTVLSSYLYEDNQTEASRIMLDIALKADPDYSLANLLDRVYKGQWAPSTFVTMAKDTHAGVLQILERRYDID